MHKQFFRQCLRESLKSRFSFNNPLLLISIILISFAISSCGSQCDEICINNKIDEGKTVVKQLKEYRSDKLQKQYDDDKNEYDDYYKKLEFELPNLGITTHEELLKSCQTNFELCNLLERAAILQQSLNVLKNKINKSNLKISELEQNIWKLEHKQELKGIISPQEQNEFEELRISTEVLVEEQVKPSEAQDTGKLTQQIFDNIVNKKSGVAPLPDLNFN
ncbi:hypothetical protein [Nostoc sp. CCY 9925]|uniref:hypothetical protein n=1 Tax=Nostoc sp. CCY 9925 TaxID=3103865 RepID=UPI0039C5C7E6